MAWHGITGKQDPVITAFIILLSLWDDISYNSDQKHFFPKNLSFLRVLY